MAQSLSGPLAPMSVVEKRRGRFGRSGGVNFYDCEVVVFFQADFFHFFLGLKVN